MNCPFCNTAAQTAGAQCTNCHRQIPAAGSLALWTAQNRRWIIAAIIGAFVLFCCLCLALTSFVGLGISRSAAAASAITPAPYVPDPPVSALPSGSSSTGSSTTGFCSNAPVNPVDNETVGLQANSFYVIEEFDNRLSTPEHKFWAYDTKVQGVKNVWAVASWGMRAWSCSNLDSANETAFSVAHTYKANHPTHKVTGPDGNEVK